MKKILLIDDSDTYTWCLQKYLQHQGYLVKTVFTLKEAAKRQGSTLCMDKMKGLLLQDKLVEYAYRQLSGEQAPIFHKLLFVHAKEVITWEISCI